MRIVATSDTHGQFGKVKLPVGDILVVAGDILRNFVLDKFVDSSIQLGHLRDDFVPWLRTIRKLYSNILIVPGNHDRCFEHATKESREIVEGVPGVHLLIDQGVTIDGVKFWGSPWSTWFGGETWSFNIPQREGAAQEIWAKIPADTNVLITHGPAYGIMDFCDGRNTGCIHLRNRIWQVRPKLHICGHIHQCVGRLPADGITYINAAYLDNRNIPQVIEI